MRHPSCSAPKSGVVLEAEAVEPVVPELSILRAASTDRTGFIPGFSTGLREDAMLVSFLPHSGLRAENLDAPSSSCSSLWLQR